MRTNARVPLARITRRTRPERILIHVALILHVNGLKMMREHVLFLSTPVKVRQYVVVRAESSPSVRGNTSVFRSPHRRNACERVLRYVDGKERRIRYPCDEMQEEDGLVVCTEPRCTTQVDDRSMAEDQDGANNNAYGITETSTSTSVEEDNVTNDVGTREQASLLGESASPLDFLRHVTSKEYQDQQEKEYDRIKESFYVAVDGCPWPVPRSVYTIVVSHEQHCEKEARHSMYTLRTRIQQHNVESELNSLLFSKKKKNVIRCSSLVDGVVLFQNESEAIEYGEMVDMNLTGGKVHIAEHNSHALFRDLVESKAVAVVIKEGCDIPNPQKLRAVLLDSNAGTLPS